MTTGHSSSPPVPDDQLVARLLTLAESYTFDCKRIIGKVDKLLETVVAFANADGGMIALGFEDPSKAAGTDRVYGLQENLLNWDELLRKLKSRITEPDQLRCTPQQIVCTLRDGIIGSIGLLRIGKSTRVHSIVDDGTYVRLQQGNKEITATEINDLSFARGTISAESQLTEVDFDLPMGGNLHFRGTVDRLDRRSDGSYEVVEYKTNAEGWTPERTASDLQMTLYALGMRRALKVPAVTLRYHFLSNGELRPVSRSAEQLAAAETLIDEIGSKIREKFYAPNHAHCARCEFAGRCVNYRPIPAGEKT